MLRDLIVRNRSYRRFDESKPIGMDVLRELVDLARLSASGGNMQSLKFYLSVEQEKNNAINDCLKWAGYLQGWGPKQGERATAFIVMVKDKERAGSTAYDEGIAAQSILLGAAEKGLGGCMLGAVDRKKLPGVLEIGEQYETLLVVALGYPSETVVIEEVDVLGDIKYWRDEQSVHHVPKRKLNDIIIK
ncbi:MAG: nitroreductase family protein [Clostridia bacterium]|jgi:nitroreductase|nr:nitroreductase family protein [Clostridia bacterium]MBT7122287.1 nitroreductase family protein [Clostridia bacterium]